MPLDRNHYPPLYSGRKHPGRRWPRRFSIFTWASMPDLLAALFFNGFDREVPPEFWTEDVEEDGTPVAVLACVCGETPKVSLYRTAECSGCDRVFLNLGGHIRVGRLSGSEEEKPESADGSA